MPKCMYVSVPRRNFSDGCSPAAENARMAKDNPHNAPAMQRTKHMSRNRNNALFFDNENKERERQKCARRVLCTRRFSPSRALLCCYLTTNLPHTGPFTATEVKCSIYTHSDNATAPPHICYFNIIFEGSRSFELNRAHFFHLLLEIVLHEIYLHTLFHFLMFVLLCLLTFCKEKYFPENKFAKHNISVLT